MFMKKKDTKVEKPVDIEVKKQATPAETEFEKAVLAAVRNLSDRLDALEARKEEAPAPVEVPAKSARTDAKRIESIEKTLELVVEDLNHLATQPKQLRVNRGKKD